MIRIKFALGRYGDARHSHDRAAAKPDCRVTALRWDGKRWTYDILPAGCGRACLARYPHTT